jgi:biofilm PGA synthesis N-glycosyltransferase PgaC
MRSPSYVLVTPVRNEERTISITIDSVARQSIRPAEWIIVSDESTDHTDEIIKEYASKLDFIRFLRLTSRPERNFGSVVFATNAGIAALSADGYEFIGLLDADIKLAETYYEELLRRFLGEPKLGLAGGMVTDCYKGRRRRHVQSLSEVAGAVQLFRRECFESLGGLIALPEGGWDAITCVQARMRGFATRTFSEIKVDHLKPRNIAEGNYFRRTWQLGMREYALGNHPLFELFKCGYHCVHLPPFFGGFLRLAAFAWCCLEGRKRILPEETIRYIRREQLSRLRRFWSPAIHIAEPSEV